MLKKGLKYEGIALKFLLKQGLALEERNYHCRMGEIDLIMNQDSCLVFIEVRYRKSPKYGSAAESVTYAKQQKICKAAAAYLNSKSRWNCNIRYDVVAIEPSHKKTDPLSINWIKSAFEHTGKI